MTSPTNSVTTDEGRYYEHPDYPDRHFYSITTIIGDGVPKPIISKWATKKAVDLALTEFGKLSRLMQRAEETDIATRERRK